MKTIVFVRNVAGPRMYNQAYALKKSNKYRLTLLCRTFDEIMLGKFREVFDEIICYQPLDLQKHWLTQNVKSSPSVHFMKYVIAHYIDPRIGQMSERIRLPRILRQLKPDVCVCPSGEWNIVTQVMKNTKCPIILDMHNGSIARGIENLSKEDYKKEKYCFEHASGIIHRGPPEIEINYFKEHKYHITCPTLQFLDYCNRGFFANHNVKKLSSVDGEYHIVNPGSGLSSHYTVPQSRKLIKQKIHLHVYPVPYSIISPYTFKEHRKLNETEKYYHFEKTVPFDKVTQEISRYDFGIMIDPPQELDCYTKTHLKVVYSYRINTYLDAGLPIIVNDRIEYMNNIIKENGIGVSIKDKELDNIPDVINRYDYEELRKNVFKTREKLLIDNHAEKLIKFYDIVIQQN